MSGVGRQVGQRSGEAGIGLVGKDLSDERSAIDGPRPGCPRPQLGGRPTVDRDHHRLASLHPFEHVVGVVPQLVHRDVPHRQTLEPHAPSPSVECGARPYAGRVAGTVEPPELARLVELSEWPRHQGWSLRAALVRYAQPQPARAAAVLQVVRRIDAVLHGQRRLLEREGPAVWAAVQAGDPGPLPDLFRAVAPLDRLADRITEWAPERAGVRPDTEIDTVVAEVTATLDGLGVPHEQREPPPGARRRA